jgi:8-oxo-dGTP diphosphatase
MLLNPLGTWALPGGHLEFGESFEACAAREVFEETGLIVTNIYFLTATNDIMEADGKHYITIFVGCTVNGENTQPQVITVTVLLSRILLTFFDVKVLEPEKCAQWEWVTWERIQSYFDAQIEASRNETGGGMPNFDGPRLFIPILNLFRQRPMLQPINEYARLSASP